MMIYLKIAFIALLLVSTCLGGLTFHFYYFSLPFASLLFPILFLLVVLLADYMKPKQLAAFLIPVSLLNLLATAFLENVYDLHLHDFWSGGLLISEETMYFMLSAGFHIGAIAAISIMYLWRQVKPLYHYFKITLAVLVANIIDVAFMWHALSAYSEDSYISSWKLLTVATFKLNILLICLPVAWGLIWLMPPKQKLNSIHS